MKPNPKICLAWSAALLVASLIMAYQRVNQLTVHAQSNQEIALYKIAEIPSPGIYKMVHHGCAIYVAKDYHQEYKYSDSITLSITTGEGCK